MNTYVKYCANVFVAKCEEEHEKGETIIVTTKYGKENECEVHNLVASRNGFYYYSITRVDGVDAKERLRRKAEKYSQAAINAETRSEAYINKSNEATKDIVLGQPILVGHHSESKHRKALEKSHRAMDNAVSEMKKAEEYSDKADQFRSMVNDKLAKMTPEQRESYRIGNVQINLAFILMEGCDWLLREGENNLKECGQCNGLRFDVKRDFKLMLKNLMMTRTMLKDFSRVVYKLEDAESACEDSDELMEMIYIYLDRAGEDRELGLKIRSMVKNSFPSKNIMEKRK